MGIVACRVSTLLILQAITPFHENRVWPREITNQLWSQYRSGEVVSCLQAEKLRVLHWLASQLASCYPVYRICYRFKKLSSSEALYLQQVMHQIATSAFRKKQNFGQEIFGKSLPICQICQDFNSPSKILYHKQFQSTTL